MPSIVVFEYQGTSTPRISFTGVSRRWKSFLQIRYEGLDNSSWLLKLKAFLMRLNGSEVYVTLPLGPLEFFDLSESSKDFTLSEAVEIAEFFVEIETRDCYWFPFESSTFAVLDGIFRVCRPRLMKTNLSRAATGITEVMYEMLVLKSNAYYYCQFPRINSTIWQSSLKGVTDVTILYDGSPKQLRRNTPKDIFLRFLKNRGCGISFASTWNRELATTLVRGNQLKS
ncbi:OLC1v1018712C1 [Oldenlandia corymbosa var. corymbosa]|uniref:OLC1v1018712C1 n=1 Tax=Oldenlandia corymbosa var. corymbosa TaxID=529605 RepID=A0AAV1EC70_OLDCO|nr:OLC1v1018712C1 [Oldenlandia corymbosa var. corymbosa]